MPLKSGVLAFSSGLYMYSSILDELLKRSWLLRSDVTSSGVRYEAALYVYLHKTRFGGTSQTINEKNIYIYIYVRNTE